MTNWTHRTMIVPAAFVPLARALAATSGPSGSGVGMWVTELSPDSGRPPTHYISAGLIWPEFAELLPTHDAEMWDAMSAEEKADSQRPTDSAGHPDQVVAMAAQKGATVSLAQVQALFSAARVYTCGWQCALDHLGLKQVRDGSHEVA
jgi:hypothetical protein